MTESTPSTEVQHGQSGRTPLKLAVPPAEAARALGCSRSYLYGLWANGAGPKRVRRGRKVFVLVADLEAWLRDHQDA